MEWRDEGIVISTRRHGETSLIVELLTRQHGRHAGMVRGGRSKRYRPILQLGNKVEAVWRARLPEHLGMYQMEGLNLRAALIMGDQAGLLALQSICVLAALIADRDPHEGLYEATDLLVKEIADGNSWGDLLVHWELGLLGELGFGLDLETCVATGSTEDLIYVSPKSGRAVSAQAGEPYKEKLLSLPPFLRGEKRGRANDDEVRTGLALTGFFIEKHMYTPLEQHLPAVRQMLVLHVS